jgi:hypothetical protein
MTMSGGVANTNVITSALLSSTDAMAWKRWQEKLLGITILTIHFGFSNRFVLPWLQRIALVNHHHDADGPATNNAAPRTLLITVLVCALINITSHVLVLVGRLQHVYVISILIGVGWDVLSSLLYVATLVQHLKMNDFSGMNNLQHSPMLLIWISQWAWNWLLHLRALRFWANPRSLESVIQSAHNNLRGIPGYYGKDHIFAYTDLGNHVLVA